MRIVSLAHAVMTTSGRHVAMRTVPLMSGVAVLAAIVFGPHGMRAHDVTQMLAASAATRLVVWSVWIMLARSATADAFEAPGTRTLRSLRPPKTWMTLLMVSLLAFAQLPFALLMACGDGIMRGVSTTLLAVALVASSRDVLRSRYALGAFTCAAMMVVLDPSPALAVLPAAGLALVATGAAWRQALEGRRAAVRIVRPSPPVVALALSYLARMVRTARGRVGAAAMMFAAAGATLALTLRNDPDARPWQRAFVVFALPSSIASALLATPAVETEAQLRPWLRQTRTSPFVLVAAVALALATPSTAFASTAGVIAAAASHATASIAWATTSAAVSIACAVAPWARFAARSRRPSTFFLGVIGIAVLSTTLAAAC
jgi:hypothetical protein